MSRAATSRVRRVVAPVETVADEEVLEIKTAKIFGPLAESARYKGVRGGRGSGKSHDRAGALIEAHMAYPGFRSVCIREVQKSLKRSSKQLLVDKIHEFGAQDSFEVLNSEIRTPGDGYIIFQGMQDHTAESIKSLEGVDVAWFEEAQSCSQRSLDLLRPTIRKDPVTRNGKVLRPGSELWFTWNTRYKDDPVDKFFFGGEPPPNSVIIEAHYMHNPWFPTVLRDEMEWDRRRDPQKYAHVWLGGYLMRNDARVFNNWKVEDFDTPSGAVFYLGGDWGFSVDPSVLIRCYIEGRVLYIDRECFAIGCEIDHLPALFDTLDPDAPAMARKWTIRADSARPETISYMRRHGYPRIVKANKGAGSVEDGIEFLRSYDVIVHPRCVHTIDELTYYSYKIDKLTDQVLPVLDDKKNNVIDALRYAVELVRYAVQGGAHAEESQVSRINASDATLTRSIVIDVDADGMGTEYYDGGLM